MKLAVFTDLTGDEVWIAPAWVIKLSVSDIPEFGPRAHTVIHLSGGVQAVCEKPEDVARDLEAAS